MVGVINAAPTVLRPAWILLIHLSKFEGEIDCFCRKPIVLLQTFFSLFLKWQKHTLPIPSHTATYYNGNKTLALFSLL